MTDGTKLMSERVYYRNPFTNVTIGIEIHGSVDITRLKEAIILTSKQIDLLSCKICSDDGKQCYMVHIDPPGTIVDVVDVPDGLPVDEDLVNKLRCNFYSLEKGITSHFLICKTKYGAQLFCSVHHIIADGRSMVKILQQIIDNYLGKTITKQIYGSLIVKNEKVTAETKAKLTSINNVLGKIWEKEGKVFSDEDMRQINDMSRRLSFSYNSTVYEGEEYHKVMDSCKKRQISVTSDFCDRYFRNDSSIEKLEVMVDLNSEPSWVGNFVSMISLYRKEFEQQSDGERVKRIQKILKEKVNIEKGTYDNMYALLNISPTFYDSIVFYLMGIYNKKVCGGLLKAMQMDRTSNTCMISNLGIVSLSDKDDFQVDNMIFLPPASIVRKCTVGIVSYKNKMTVTEQYLTK